MTNVEKVNQVLDKAKTFFFLTTDDDQPEDRSFGFHILLDGKIYFGCGTFQNVYKQMEKNPYVEIVALVDGGFMRYDGIANMVKDDVLVEKMREIMTQIMAMYEKNNWAMGLFYSENGCAEIRGLLGLKEEFDV